MNTAECIGDCIRRRWRLIKRYHKKKKMKRNQHKRIYQTMHSHVNPWCGKQKFVCTYTDTDINTHTRHPRRCAYVDTTIPIRAYFIRIRQKYSHGCDLKQRTVAVAVTLSVFVLVVAPNVLVCVSAVYVYASMTFVGFALAYAIGMAVDSCRLT